MTKVAFRNEDGLSLAARLDMPKHEIPVKAYVLFAHCFTCTKDIFAASRIAATLQKEGFAVLRFDFSGLGASEGDFANTNFSSNVSDLVAAADYLRSEHTAPAIIVGHSLGGAAVLAAASHISECKAVVTIGAPSDVAHVAHHFQNEREEIMESGEADICLVGRPFKIKKQFIEDIESTHIQGAVENLRKALLVMHAPLDQTVGIENAGHIFSWAKHPKSYISLDDADHLLSRKEDAEYAGGMIASWAQRYI